MKIKHHTQLKKLKKNMINSIKTQSTITLLITILTYGNIQSQVFDGNLASKSLKWSLEQKDFTSLPRVGIDPMSIKLWDNYNGTSAPSSYGSLLEISGRSGHLVSQMYFNSTWEGGRILYRSAFYNQTSWNEWRYLLDSKSDVETSGNLKITGNSNSYILNGNVGIGTITPAFAKLQVDGGLNSRLIHAESTLTPTAGVTAVQGISLGQINIGGITNPGYALIGYNVTNLSSLGITSQVAQSSDTGAVPLNMIQANRLNDAGVGAALVVNRPILGINNFSNRLMTILNNGNVGIGTATPDTKLTVNGTIHATEVKVTTTVPVPDYVFASDYKLKTLQEVEDYIYKNSHLPEIPSAQEIDKNGLMLAEMNMNLLKKVEELTLYMIEQNKRLETQQKENNVQSKEIEVQSKEIDTLKKENESFKTLSERFSKIENQLNKQN